MHNLPSKVNDIHSKVHNLIILSEKLRKEIGDLQASNEKQKITIEEQKTELKELQEKLKIIKLAKSIKESEGAHEAKLKINELIREVDKCIAQLNC